MNKSKYTFEVRIDETTVVLMNLLSFQIMKINGENKYYWESNNYEKIERCILNELVRGKYLVESEMEDLHLLNRAFQYFGKAKEDVPSHTIYITSKCNMRCPYCFEKNLDFQEENLTKEKIEKVIEAIQHNGGKKGLKKILIFGGEPFLRENKNIVIYLLERLRQFKYRYVEIVTNGMEVTYFEKVLEKYSDVISSVRFTLNGERKTHNNIRDTPKYEDTYEKIISGINIVLKLKMIQVNINVLLDKYNINTINEMISDLNKREILNNPKVSLGFGRTQFAIAPEQANYKYEIPIDEYYSLLINLYKNNPHLNPEYFQGGEVPIINDIIKCFAMKHNPFITPNLVTCRATNPGRFCYFVDGKIYPCTEVAGVSQYAIGEYYPRYIEYSTKKKWLEYEFPKKCKECNFVSFCNGGCLVSNCAMNGEISNVYCNDVKQALSNAILKLYEGDFL